MTNANIVTQIEEVVTFASSSDPPQYSRHQGALRRTGEKMKLAKLLLLQSEQDIAVSVSRFLFTLGSYSVSWHFSQKL